MKKTLFFMLVSISPPATTPNIATFSDYLFRLPSQITQLEKVKKLFFVDLFFGGCKKHYFGMSVSKTHHEITTFAPKPIKTR